MKKILISCIAAFALLGLSGCSSTKNPDDPLEGFNRTMFGFNQGVDKIVLKPIATGYKTVTPEFARQGVSNFFGNLEGAWSTVNAGLQLKGEKFLTGFFRVGVNTTLGLGGLMDVASEIGLDDPQEDFGQTLGYWGVGTGPYIVWPFFGSSNVRDTVGSGVDVFGDPLLYVKSDKVSYGLAALGLVNMRAQLIGADSVVEDGMLDQYAFFKNAYMQRRQNLVYDGNPPVDPDFEFDDDEL